MTEATQVLVWAIIPVGGWAIAGDPVPLIMLLGITGLAGLLRASESWEFTLLGSIVVGLCVEIYLRLQPAVLDLIFLQMQPYFDANGIQGEQLDSLRNVMTSFMGAVYMFLAIVLLMLSRWMQAAVFNPGGFQKEFHGLRIEQKVALFLVGSMMLANFGILIPQSWIAVFGFTADVLRACPSACGGSGEEVIEPLVSRAVCDNRVAINSEYDRVARTTRQLVRF